MVRRRNRLAMGFPRSTSSLRPTLRWCILEGRYPLWSWFDVGEIEACRLLGFFDLGFIDRLTPHWPFTRRKRDAMGFANCLRNYYRRSRNARSFRPRRNEVRE